MSNNSKLYNFWSKHTLPTTSEDFILYIIYKVLNFR